MKIITTAIGHKVTFGVLDTAATPILTPISDAVLGFSQNYLGNVLSTLAEGFPSFLKKLHSTLLNVSLTALDLIPFPLLNLLIHNI